MNDTKKDLLEALHDYFNPKEENGERRFFDATQIPRICEDIRFIKKDVSLLKRIIFGAIALILTAWVMNTLNIKL